MIVAVIVGIVSGLALSWLARTPGWVGKVLAVGLAVAALVVLNVYSPANTHRLDLQLGFVLALPVHMWQVNKAARRRSTRMVSAQRTS